jgi:hypothetical protein
MARNERDRLLVQTGTNTTPGGNSAPVGNAPNGNTSNPAPPTSVPPQNPAPPPH